MGRPRFTFAPGLAPSDADQVISDVYGQLAVEAEARPAALVLDEFQAITRHGAHLPFLLKGPQGSERRAPFLSGSYARDLSSNRR